MLVRAGDAAFLCAVTLGPGSRADGIGGRRVLVRRSAGRALEEIGAEVAVKATMNRCRRLLPQTRPTDRASWAAEAAEMADG